MKYLYLVWKSLWRKKVRTILTILSIFVAFFLFGILSALQQAFSGDVGVAGESRLMVLDKVSIMNPLPSSYTNRIQAIDGVNRVAHADWFGGYYQDQRNQFPQFAVDPDVYLAVYPELTLPDEQRQRWERTRDSVIVGRDLVDRFGWSVGDRLPIHSSIWTKKDGGQVWEFEVAGIFENENKSSNSLLMLLHYDYFDEARAFGNGTIGWFIVDIDDPESSAAVANQIDSQFANSANETKSSSEAAFTASFVSQYGNIALIISLILGAVFFTILLLSGNTMAQSVRERIPELAVLKTLGFQDTGVLGIVLAESVFVMILGGTLGLATAWFMATFVLPGAAGIPGMILSAKAIGLGFLYMVLAGIVAGLFPALRAMRLTITDALARA